MKTSSIIFPDAGLSWSNGQGSFLFGHSLGGRQLLVPTTGDPCGSLMQDLFRVRLFQYFLTVVLNVVVFPFHIPKTP